VKVVFAVPPPCGSLWGNANVLRQLKSAILGLPATLGVRAAVVDNDSGFSHGYHSNDQCHPNVVGDAFIADNMARVVLNHCGGIDVSGGLPSITNADVTGTPREFGYDAQCIRPPSPPSPPSPPAACIPTPCTNAADDDYQPCPGTDNGILCGSVYTDFDFTLNCDTSNPDVTAQIAACNQEFCPLNCNTCPTSDCDDDDSGYESSTLALKNDDGDDDNVALMIAVVVIVVLILAAGCACFRARRKVKARVALRKPTQLEHPPSP